ncbi:MAG: HigA family addiction module antidote protein [Magnetococcales bacterium]|nr:HigA family addiction module antidote protein [Magnetococcales bacterium]
MNKPIANQYVPDHAVHPGEILEEYLSALGMNQTELSARTGIVLKHINEIIRGKAAITVDTALKLERTVGHSASFWNNLQQLYEQDIARLADNKRLEEDLGWLKQIPVRKMAEAGWIRTFQDKKEQLAEILRFFGVASRAQWESVWSGSPVAAFRQSRNGTISETAVSAWLRQGEIQAQATQCASFDKAGFENVLTEARHLTREPPRIFQPRLIELCAGVGVAVVFVPELPKTGISGATRWLTPNKALIQLSLRYKADDQLWFTFFHEAGHILRHGKKDVFLEGVAGMNQEKENEANQFAADFLIPADRWATFKQKHPYTLATVRSFAETLEIAPGIVIGRLQHEKIVAFKWGNNLKCRLTWQKAGQDNSGWRNTNDAILDE